MRYHFAVIIDGSGPTLEKAYQEMRRKLLPMKGWADTDTVYSKASEDVHVMVPEEDVQAARKAFPPSRDGRRRCNGGNNCLHDVVVYGIPACMMSRKEIKKMVKRGRKMQATSKSHEAEKND